MSKFYEIVGATESTANADEAEHATDTEHSAETTTATTESHSTTKESEGIGALGLDPIAIGAQALTFLLLLWIVKKYALDGIVKNLDKRHNDIDRGLHLTAEMDKQKLELEERVEKVLQKARKDADLVIAEAHTDSNKIIHAAEESASRKADNILKEAEAKIERDIATARQSLKGEMASLITEATETILGEKLDNNGDRKLVEKYLSEVVK